MSDNKENNPFIVKVSERKYDNNGMPIFTKEDLYGKDAKPDVAGVTSGKKETKFKEASLLDKHVSQKEYNRYQAFIWKWKASSYEEAKAKEAAYFAEKEQWDINKANTDAHETETSQAEAEYYDTLYQGCGDPTTPGYEECVQKQLAANGAYDGGKTSSGKKKAWSGKGGSYSSGAKKKLKLWPLRKGSKGALVKRWQKHLNDTSSATGTAKLKKGSPIKTNLSVDGDFGAKTAYVTKIYINKHSVSKADFKKYVEWTSHKDDLKSIVGVDWWINEGNNEQKITHKG